MNVILVVLSVAGRMLKCKTAGRKSEVGWVTILFLNISEPGRDGKGAADNFGLVKQNFPLGLKGSTYCRHISFSHCEGIVPREHSNTIPYTFGWVGNINLELWVLFCLQLHLF